MATCFQSYAKMQIQQIVEYWKLNFWKFKKKNNYSCHKPVTIYKIESNGINI